MNETKLIETIFHRLLENRLLSRWTVLFIDLVIITIATLISFFVSSSIYKIIPEVAHPPLSRYIITTVGITFLSFLIFRTNVGIIRYSTLYELQKIFGALLCACIGVFCFMYFISDPSGSISLAYCISFLLFSLIGLFSFRIFIINIYLFLQLKYSGKNRCFFIWLG